MGVKGVIVLIITEMQTMRRNGMRGALMTRIKTWLNKISMISICSREKNLNNPSSNSSNNNIQHKRRVSISQ